MEIFVYLLKINLSIVIFGIIYKSFFCRDTFFSMRRYLLLSMLLLSVVYPLIDLSCWFTGEGAVRDLALSYINILPEVAIYAPDVATPAGNVSIEIHSIILYIYFAVVCFFIFRILFHTIQIVRLRLHSEYVTVEEVRVNRLDVNTTPFSFFCGYLSIQICMMKKTCVK